MMPPVAEEDDSGGGKRKAEASPEQGRAAKRTPAGTPAPQGSPPLEERRREVGEVYAAYHALFSAPPGEAAPESSFLRLVQAGQGECAQGSAHWLLAPALPPAVPTPPLPPLPPLGVPHLPPAAPPPLRRLRGLPPPGSTPGPPFRAAVSAALHPRRRPAHFTGQPLPLGCASCATSQRQMGCPLLPLISLDPPMSHWQLAILPGGYTLKHRHYITALPCVSCLPAEPEQQAAARADAAAGLAAVAAAAKAAGSAGQQATIKLVDFCFKWVVLLGVLAAPACQGCVSAPFAVYCLQRPALRHACWRLPARQL